MIGVLIALVIGIAIGQDAKKRGMNAWAWGIGVFLLLIIFLPLYFITRKPKLEDQQKASIDTSDDILDDSEIE
jgi:phosphotransferase system  glucose/maltose/N-acetylglucosamine-specific IIC component